MFIIIYIYTPVLFSLLEVKKTLGFVFLLVKTVFYRNAPSSYYFIYYQHSIVLEYGTLKHHENTYGRLFLSYRSAMSQKYRHFFSDEHVADDKEDHKIEF